MIRLLPIQGASRGTCVVITCTVASDRNSTCGDLRHWTVRVPPADTEGRGGSRQRLLVRRQTWGTVKALISPVRARARGAAFLTGSGSGPRQCNVNRHDGPPGISDGTIPRRSGPRARAL